jgi:hypothetical protein
MTDAQKTQYLIKYLAQRVASLMRSHPTQNREWGSAIYRTPNGFGFTPLTPTTTHTANVAWGSLPQSNGQTDWGSVVALVHSHPRLNLNPQNGQDNWTYYDPADPSYLLRPWGGDWLSYTSLQSNMGSSPNAATLAMFILGYTEVGGVGRLSLRQYNSSHNPGGGAQTPTATPEEAELAPPCNEFL